MNAADAAWLHIDSIDLDAQGVGRRADGKVVFVDGALPGEDVQVAIVRRKNQWEQGAEGSNPFTPNLLTQRL